MRRVLRRGLLLVGLLSGATAVGPARAQLVGATAVASQSYAPPEYIRKPPALPALWAGRRPRSLTLNEAIELALRHNLGLALQREQVHLVDIGRSQALANFEPSLSASADRTTSQSPPRTRQEGEAGQVPRYTSDNWNVALSEQLPTGTTVSLSFNNNRAESTLGTAVAPLIFRSQLALGINQALLQGFSFSGRVQWAPVLQAEFDSEAARQTARQTAMLAIKATEDAYWNLVQSFKAYEVAREAQEVADKQLELTRRKIAAGVQPESELLSVEGTQANRQLEVVRAEAQIETYADVLRQQLNLPAPEWEQPLLPTDAPTFLRVVVPFTAAWERALVLRPDLKQVQIDLRKGSLLLEVAQNARLPMLNARGNLSAVGQDADYGQALGQLGARAGWLWTVGLDFAWAPIGVASRANVRRWQTALRLNSLNREQKLVEIRFQLRTALRTIDTAERKLYAAAKSRDLAERNLDVEQRKFLNGLPGSSNYMVATRQAELSQARLSELQALIDHQIARSDLQLQIGELLEVRHLSFEVRKGG
jgi:outer membrane protein TolC